MQPTGTSEINFKEYRFQAKPQIKLSSSLHTRVLYQVHIFDTYDLYQIKLYSVNGKNWGAWAALLEKSNFSWQGDKHRQLYQQTTHIPLKWKNIKNIPSPMLSQYNKDNKDIDILTSQIQCEPIYAQFCLTKTGLMFPKTINSTHCQVSVNA